MFDLAQFFMQIQILHAMMMEELQIHLHCLQCVFTLCFPFYYESGNSNACIFIFIRSTHVMIVVIKRKQHANALLVMVAKFKKAQFDSLTQCK